MITHPYNRRGSVYIAIIGASTLVAIIGVCAIIAARVQLRTSTLAADIDDARMCARSTIEMGKLWIASDPSWRTNHPNGTWANNVVLNGGSISLDGFDPNDGDLANWPTDPITLTATARKGGATQIQQVTLVPRAIPLECLGVGVMAGGSISFNSADVTCDQTIATNSSFSASNGSKIDSRVEASSSISGSMYYGTKASGVAQRTMPASTAIDSYIANATPINLSALSGGRIENGVLSPTRNSFGATVNPVGLYVVECNGNRVRVLNCRIVGTLIILNPKSDSTIEGSVNFAPAVQNFPSLLVRGGGMNFLYGNAPLSESALGRNFNPPGTPYGGVSNSTTNDTYPSQISGLVYVSGNATFSGNATLSGVFVAGGGLSGGDISMTYDAAFLTNPPPGFCTTSPMIVSPGSWKPAVR